MITENFLFFSYCWKATQPNIALARPSTKCLEPIRFYDLTFSKVLATVIICVFYHLYHQFSTPNNFLLVSFFLLHWTNYLILINFKTYISTPILDFKSKSSLLNDKSANSTGQWERRDPSTFTSQDSWNTLPGISWEILNLISQSPTFIW